MDMTPLNHLHTFEYWGKTIKGERGKKYERRMEQGFEG